MELVRLQQDVAEFDRRGVAIVAASTDTPAQSAATRAEWGLSFDVLSADVASLRALGVLHPRGGVGGRDVAVPTLALLDREGRVVRTYQARQTQLRLQPYEVLAWIDGNAPRVSP